MIKVYYGNVRIRFVKWGEKALFTHVVDARVHSLSLPQVVMKASLLTFYYIDIWGPRLRASLPPGKRCGVW